MRLYIRNYVLVISIKIFIGNKSVGQWVKAWLEFALLTVDAQHYIIGVLGLHPLVGHRGKQFP